MNANLAVASDSGDRLEALVELRQQLAQAIDECSSARDLAALSARFMDVLEQIGQVESRQAPRSSARDEIAARRAAKATSARRPERKAQ